MKEYQVVTVHAGCSVQRAGKVIHYNRGSSLEQTVEEILNIYAQNGWTVTSMVSPCDECGKILIAFEKE